jgi:hypothetical protein
VVFTVLLLGDFFADFFDVGRAGRAGRARAAGLAGAVTCSVVFLAADFFAVVPVLFLACAVVRLVRVAAV